MIPISWIPYLLAAPLIVIIALVLYKFKIQPTIQYPLPNEQDEGIWRIPLPQLGKMNEGRVTTARRYVQSLFAKIIDNLENEDERQKVIKLRDKLLNYYLFAQKTSNGKVIYLFDDNPLDPQFHMRQDIPQHLAPDIPMRFVYGVKDCMSTGEWDGFEYVAVKLKPETSFLNQDERQMVSIFEDALRFLRLAATNTEQIKFLKEVNKNLELQLDDALRNSASIRSEKERARRALSQKSLLMPEVPQARAPFWRAIKQSFGWAQVAVALATYLLVPNIMGHFGVTYPDPGTLAVALGVVAFFVTPFVLGLIKR